MVVSSKAAQQELEREKRMRLEFIGTDLYPYRMCRHHRIWILVKLGLNLHQGCHGNCKLHRQTQAQKML
jgi:hypothetical protein